MMMDRTTDSCGVMMSTSTSTGVARSSCDDHKRHHRAAACIDKMQMILMYLTTSSFSTVCWHRVSKFKV